jgi:hypothetical protein
VENRASVVTKVVIMGAAGRDFHNFNVAFRSNPAYEVVAFTAAQIPYIAGRIYPPVLAGERYPGGIPIVPEENLEAVIAAAMELATCAEARGISDDNIICTMDEWEVVPRIAAATALKAQEQGVAQLSRTKAQVMEHAARQIRIVRDAVRLLMQEGAILPPPQD